MSEGHFYFSITETMVIFHAYSLVLPLPLTLTYSTSNFEKCRIYKNVINNVNLYTNDQCWTLMKIQNQKWPPVQHILCHVSDTRY